MSIYTHPIASLDGEPLDLDGLKGKAVLVVNVASKCGLTPQYTGLEELQKKYADRGFTVLGVPCNQFGGQEPGTADEISTFCSANYGVTFPITEKVDVNGQKRHPLFTEFDGDVGRDRRSRRYPVELREVLGFPGRRNRRALSAPGDTRLRGARRGTRISPAQLGPTASWVQFDWIPASAAKTGNVADGARSAPR